jgi:hypothetical protein
MPNGIWQLNLPPALFRTSEPPIAIHRIGTYWLENGHFLYFWCDDFEVRRNAALDRTLQLIEQYKTSITEREVEKNLQLLAEQLSTRTLKLSDLKQRAQETGRLALLTSIDLVS